MAMLECVADKFTHDVPKLCEDDNLLSHVVDEMLLFHRELNMTHEFPISQLNCLHVLTEEPCFSRWLEIEKKSNNNTTESVQRDRSFCCDVDAELRLKTLLSVPTAWCLLYKDMPDVDDLRVPECAETVMTFLRSVEGRFEYLPLFSCQQQFVQLQKDVLSAFRVELINVAKAEGKNVISQRYVLVINSANYVLGVVRDWMERPV